MCPFPPLTAYAKTFLRVGYTGVFDRGISKNYIFELVHARIGEHQCGVILHYHGGRGNNAMAF